MYRSLAAFSVLLVALPQARAFLFGGGCCGAPVMQSPCCGGATSWAYAPPQVIGYERIPLYAKVPMPAPPQYFRSRPIPRVSIIQSEPYYQSAPPSLPPPPPPPPAYQNLQNSYYPPNPPPMDNFANGPSSQPSVSSVSNPIPSAIPPPQDKYNDGDVIVIETDDSRRRRMSSTRKYVQPPPQGYVSQPAAPQGYQQQPQQPQYGGQVEQGIEVTPEQISSGYQPQQQQQFATADNSIPSNYGAQGSQYGSQGSQSAGFVEQVASNAAYEATGIAPSARRLRKFKN